MITSSKAAVRSAVRRLLMMPFVLAAILFTPAGTLAWTKGWVFVAVTTAALGISAGYLWRANPEIFAARSRIQRGTKRWDRILLSFLFPVFFAIPVVAALDDGRFHWSALSWWTVAIGYVLYLAGFALTAWAQTVNRFFEPGVRIQTERGHHVIDNGPYTVIRHPGYLAAILFFTGMAISLGSLWALVPAGIVSALIVLRTVLEDRTLRKELPGYAEYAQRVRFRLIPGIW